MLKKCFLYPIMANFCFIAPYFKDLIHLVCKFQCCYNYPLSHYNYEVVYKTFDYPYWLFLYVFLCSGKTTSCIENTP